MFQTEFKEEGVLPDKILTIQFDGGCKPNPGNNYGSYVVSWKGVELARLEKFDLGHGTNNEAEYEALLKALLDVLEKMSGKNRNPKDYHLHILTDSRILEKRITKKGGKIFNKQQSASTRMRDLALKCLLELDKFGSFKVEWQGRENNVRVLGH